VEARTSSLAGKESSIFDLAKTMRGVRFSRRDVVEASRLNLIELAPALQMPAFFFLARKDHCAEISVAYIDAPTAPSRKLVWFEDSGHEPFVDEPAKFNAAMVGLVRPLLPSDLPPRTA